MKTRARHIAIALDALFLCVLHGIGLSLVASASTGLSYWRPGDSALDSLLGGLIAYGVVAWFLGALTGLAVSPIVMVCTIRKPAIWPSIILWSPAYGLALLGGIAGGPFLAGFLTFTAVIGASIVIRFAYPDFHHAWECPKCRYDLRGHEGALIRCPECGKRVDRKDADGGD